MATYRHILLAVDLSGEEADQVIGKAVELARLHQARLSLLHVVEHSGAMYPGEIPLPEAFDLDQRLAESARARLEAIAVQHALEGSPCLVEIGVPKREIVRVAQERGADLIVLGSHGRHGLQLLLGSTANGVLHLAGCDVLAVRIGSA
ncbi:MAG: universal stress protein [Candidatus Sedimenticola endophacoides]